MYHHNDMGRMARAGTTLTQDARSDEKGTQVRQKRPGPDYGQRHAFMLPIKTISELNVREHWGTGARRAARQRAATASALGPAMMGMLLPHVVRITRLAPRKLDSDNLAGSQKHVRDGVADALGVDDGDGRLSWEYGQEKSKTYGVIVEMFWR